METQRKVNPKMVPYSESTFLEPILTFPGLKMTYDLMSLWSSLYKVILIETFKYFFSSCLTEKLLHKHSSYGGTQKNKGVRSAQL